jgi:hypothetical protein
VLIGDYTDRFEGFVPLVYWTQEAGIPDRITAMLYGHRPVFARCEQREESLPEHFHSGPTRYRLHFRQTQLSKEAIMINYNVHIYREMRLTFEVIGRTDSRRSPLAREKPPTSECRWSATGSL